MRVAHVGFHRDPMDREPLDLLAAWPTLGDVAAAAAATGLEVVVIQAASRDAIIERGDVRYVFVAERSARALPAAWWVPRRLLEAVCDACPDVAHVNGLSFPFATRALAERLQAVPVLVQDHGSRAPRGLRRLVHCWGFAPIAGVAFTARAQADPFFRTGVFRDGLPVLEVLESSTRMTPIDGREARERSGISGDPCCVWLGHLDANKDPLTVLTALSRAAASLPDPQLWCCFKSAPLLNAVGRRLADDPNLRGRVHLLGARPHADIPLLLSAADFLLQGSHVEGSGYAVIEALACGTTPLVTDIPSLRRITGDGSVGALSRPGDHEAMARAIVEWSRRDRGALRAAARAHFERALSFDVVGRELRAAYERVVQRP
jgi:glycosyltransferase involved in cell wall biosynthesis